MDKRTSMEKNKKLLIEWLNLDPYNSKEDRLWDKHVWNYAIVKGERKVWGEPTPIPRKFYPLSYYYWEEYFPDHCRGDTVLFPGAIHVLDAYVPAIIVSCSHFEYGDSLDELAELYNYAVLVGRELLDVGMYPLTTIALLNPNMEKLIMIIRPPYPECMEKAKSNPTEAMQSITKPFIFPYPDKGMKDKTYENGV